MSEGLFIFAQSSKKQTKSLTLRPKHLKTKYLAKIIKFLPCKKKTNNE